MDGCNALLKRPGDRTLRSELETFFTIRTTTIVADATKFGRIGQNSAECPAAVLLLLISCGRVPAAGVRA